VSREAKRKVLCAISGLQYSPNNHAAELGRGNRGIPRNRSICAAASSNPTAKPTPNSASGGLDKLTAAERLHLLEDENAQLRWLIADLRLDLELSKSVPVIDV
jgi:DNA-binding LacI/PurR family transcriptional regulator